MPLPLPNLDTRRWADLVSEGRALIPRYAPGWTDHNIHDPGITLIELFAWLTEAEIYRVNQIPDRHRRKFLALAGFSPLPPRAAQAIFCFTPETGTPSFVIPAGAEFEALDADNQSIPFRSLRDLTVSVVELAAIQSDAGAGVIIDRTRDWRDGLAIMPMGAAPQLGAAFYLGFDSLSTATPLAIALQAGAAQSGALERARIIREAAAQQQACQPALPDIICPDAEPVSTINAGLPPHHSARVVWEVFTGASPSPWMALEPVDSSTPSAAGQVFDDTRGLTLDGIVEINLSPAIVKTDLGKSGDVPRFYLRCRLAQGAYDAPPQLIDIAANCVSVEQAVPVWQRFKIAAKVMPGGLAPTPGMTTRLNFQVNASGTITALDFVDPSTAPDHPDVMVITYDPPTGAKEGQITLEMILAGIGEGAPDQEINLPDAPLQADSLRLFTQMGNSWQSWARRDDLDASTRMDFHFVLDATSGNLIGGNGERGRVLPAGALILVDYRRTQAAAGNLPANRSLRAMDSPRNALWLASLAPATRSQLQHICLNHLPARGGAAAEDLLAAAGRAVASLHAHERLVDLATDAGASTLDQIARSAVDALPAPARAVNLFDIERLALEVPGTRVARARAWAGVHPSYPCLDSAGVVTLVVMPDFPGPEPEPSAGLLHTVKGYLDRRRIVCTRIEIVGPQYLEVRVSGRVHVRPHTNAARVKLAIVQALDAFLDPRRGGPNGLGWPFGRDVYRGEILQVIDEVPGVDYVMELTLSAGNGKPQCGNLPVCATWLVSSGAHQIEIA
jgi:Baseplate J-like protein